MARLLVITLVAVFLRTGLRGEELPPAAEGKDGRNGLATFLHGVRMVDVTWSVYEGSEYSLYYCVAQAPRTGAAGIEISERSIGVEVKRSDIPIESALGRFPVKWFRRVIKDGSRQAETVVRCGPRQWARVLIEAKDEVGVLRFIGELGKLALFAPPKAEPAFVGPGFVDSSLRARGTEASAAAPLGRLAAACEPYAKDGQGEQSE